MGFFDSVQGKFLTIIVLYIYLLLAECEARMANYGQSFFPSFYGPSAMCAGLENREGKKKLEDL